LPDASCCPLVIAAFVRRSEPISCSAQRRANSCGNLERTAAFRPCASDWQVARFEPMISSTGMETERPDAGPTHPVTWRDLERLRTNWEELAARVAEIEANAKGSGEAPPSLDFDEEKLAAIASSIYAARRRRNELFDPSLFGEPAWDMLLILFVCKARGDEISTSALCARSNTPHATGLRWIDRLQKQGLVRRTRAAGDSRVMLVEVTANGYSLMRRYVIGGIARFQMPLPD